MQNGICNDCECNGNVDPALGPTCDMELGYCLNCQNHTYGANCELCINGYYGDPFENIDCQGNQWSSGVLASIYISEYFLMNHNL